METKFLEATNGPNNWGKFAISRFTADEWKHASSIDSRPLLRTIGWHPEHVQVFDLQTCEGATFRLGGYAKADLDKHRIWVCPLFEPMLEWLYLRYNALDHDFAAWWDTLPVHVDLPDAPFDMHGYRREGSKSVERRLKIQHGE
jgi:hypothetical protein